jgi:hypothetical protein
MTVDALLAPVLGDPGRPLHAGDCPETLDSWDSTKHIEIVVAIEDAYDIELTTAEILRLRSVGDIVEVLRNRGVEIRFSHDPQLL